MPSLLQRRVTAVWGHLALSIASSLSLEQEPFYRRKQTRRERALKAVVLVLRKGSLEWKRSYMLCNNRKEMA